MARIRTLPQFRDYIKLNVGMPILNLEMTDPQIDQIIEDTVDIFCRYMYDEGAYMDYAIIRIPAGTNELPMGEVYDMKSGTYLSNIQDVYDFNLSFGAGGINTMFSPTNILLHDQYVNKGNYPGGTGSSPNVGLTMADYTISMTYLEEISNTFGKHYTVNWLPASEILQIVPTPNKDLVGVLMFYRREQTEYLYNHVHVKKLAIAKVKKLWSLILGKYNPVMPDGSTINYDNIYNQGKEEETEVMEAIRSESSPIDFFIA